MATPPPENDENRKPTLFDRYGPDAGRLLHLRGWSLVIFLTSLFLAWGLLRRIGLSLGWAVLLTPVGALALTWVLRRAILVSSDGAGSAMQLVTLGGKAPYEDQFSLEQAMVMRGEVGEALASFERRIEARGSGVEVRVRAAELYAGEGKNPTRAAELLRAARALPELTEGQDIYVTNRLADLLAGPLNEHGRALVELRRLVERYPGTPAASHARAALSALKWRAVRDG